MVLLLDLVRVSGFNTYHKRHHILLFVIVHWFNHSGDYQVLLNIHNLVIWMFFS